MEIKKVMERFKGIFIKPSQIMEEIKEEPDKKGLLISFLTIFIMCLIIAIVAFSKFEITDYPIAKTIGFLFVPFSLTIGFFIVYFINSLLIWLLGKIFKGSGTYKQISSIFGYVSIYQVIYYIGVLFSALLMNSISGPVVEGSIFTELFTTLFSHPILMVFGIIVSIITFIYIILICKVVHQLEAKKAIIVAILILVIGFVFDIIQLFSGLFST